MLSHGIRQLDGLADNDVLWKIFHCDRGPSAQAGGQDGTGEQGWKQN
jgi:hypothetical protein